ncbi:hypothetical protein KIPB_015025, partial [Kipferlia bialata]|eukprot:g15025.t1
MAALHCRVGRVSLSLESSAPSSALQTSCPRVPLSCVRTQAPA